MSRASALLGLGQQDDRRRGARKCVLLEAKIISDDLWCVVDCTIEDRSENGAKLRFGLRVALPSCFDLVIPSEGVRIPVRGVWRRGHFIGVEFTGKARKLG